MEILNAAGEVITSVASQAGAAPGEQPEQGMRGPRGGGPAAPALERTPGLHRFWWNLAHQVPGSRGGGPTVPPGSYTVRLSVGDWSASQPIEVRIDPRVEADGVTVADLQEQYEFNLQVLSLQAEARELLRQVQAARESAQGTRAEQLDVLLADLTQRRDQAYPQPMLIEQISYLLNMTSSADQKIGNDATVRIQELREWLARARSQFQTVTD